MAFKFGASSNAQLRTCKFDLQTVVERALELSDVDFSVVEGVRSLEQQKLNVKNGVSWTLDSKHLADANGKSRAVDIYPWHNGKTDHSSDLYKKIATAMFKAAIELNVQIKWGGDWTMDYTDKPHWELC